MDEDRRESLLHRAEQLAGTGSWEWNRATGEVLWSDNMFRLFGLEPGEITPSPEYVVERTHPDDEERADRAAGELARTGRSAPVEYRIILPDGRVRHLRSTVAADRVEDQQRVIIGFVQDVTEQRRAERQIAAHVAVSEALSEWTSFEPGAEGLLRRFAEAMDCVAGVFWLPFNDLLVVRSFWHAPSIDVTDFESFTRELGFARGEGLPGRVWESKEPTDWSGALADGSFIRRDAAARADFRSGVAVPVLDGDDVLAVLEFYSREPTPMSDRLVRSLTGIGHEVGQFLGHRRGELKPRTLSTREIEILQLGARGQSTYEIAEHLGLRPDTVKTHFKNIYAKLDVTDRASAVAKALREGFMQ